MSSILLFSISDYWSDLAVPLAVTIGGIAVGFLLERIVIGLSARFFERRATQTGGDGWKLARRLVRSFNGLITVWFGLAAFRSVLTKFPLKPGAVPIVLHTESAILILSLAVLIARILIAFFRTYSTPHERAVPSISLVQNIVRAVLYLLAILAILHTYGIAITPLIAALGVGGLAVALALQDTLGNFFAGIYIIISRNIDPGDYIKLDSGQEGIVRDIAWRVTTLQTPDSSLVIVPNSKFSTSIITNYDRPDRSVIVKIEIPLDQSMPASQLEHAAMEAANETSEAMKELVEGKPELYYTAVSATGATLQLSVHITDFSRATELRHEVLRRTYLKLHPPQAPKT